MQKTIDLINKRINYKDRLNSDNLSEAEMITLLDRFVFNGFKIIQNFKKENKINTDKYSY